MRPRKRFAQHFLSDPRILGRIAGALELRGDETVIEIGPGRGALTDQLATRCKRLIAVEIDRDLVAKLREKYADRPHVEIVEGDVLKTSLGDLAGGLFSLIGNVPYNITTPIIFHALERPRPERMVFMVQKEVAERLTAKPGTKAYGALTINVQAFASVEVMFRVPARAFSPAPKVESSVVQISPLASPVVSAEEEGGFRTFVQALFSRRRKQMRVVLRAVAGVDAAAADAVLHAAGVAPTARPEEVAVREAAAIYRATK